MYSASRYWIHHCFPSEGADIVWIKGSSLEINLERKPFIINSVIIALTSLGCFYEENQNKFNIQDIHLSKATSIKFLSVAVATLQLELSVIKTSKH